ncbi:MAG: DUF423 domain-containing protein [Gammaproteobacteria bacterium]
MSFNVPSLIVIAAGISGGLGVALGAFGAHGLRGKVEERLLETFQTAVQYQMIHALALLIVAIMMLQSGRNLTLDIAAGGFVVGILLFSGSLYGLVLTDMRWLGPVTPLGGLCFIAGWVALVAAGLQQLN